MDKVCDLDERKDSIFSLILTKKAKKNVTQGIKRSEGLVHE